MPPKKSKPVETSLSDLLVSPAGVMRLTVNIGGDIWKIWSRSQYTAFGRLLELLDNALADKVKATRVHLHIDFEKGIAFIEDDGTGFPITIIELQRCFNYGATCPTDLNEHGCGLNQALASLDPSNSRWRVVWKASNGLIYQIRAPYSGSLDVHTIDTWPGQMTERPTGAYIEFPINKQHFAELYAAGKRAKMENPLANIRENLAETWMLNQRMKTGDVKLFLNNEEVTPLTLSRISDYETSSNRVVKTMSTGATIEIYQFNLKQSVPNSRFKKTNSATGYYFFKNGRLIEHIDGGSAYNQLYGAEKHPSHAGFIVLINMVGKQDQLPHTVPTKNKIPPSELRTELYDIVKDNVKIEGEITPSEESLVQAFIKMRQTNFSRLIPSYKIEEKRTLTITPDDRPAFNSPQIDIVEEVGKTTYIYEAKRNNAVDLDAIRQLYGNWIICREFYAADQTVVPCLLINTDKKLSDNEFKCLPMLFPLAAHSDMGFPLIVMNYKGEMLYEYKHNM